MKNVFFAVSALLITSLILSSCSKTYLAQQKEYDDMYYSASDRSKLEASSQEFYVENFTEDYKQPLEEDQLNEYADVNYSSKTVNPEYIAKYTSEILSEEETTSETEYFVEDYDKNNVTAEGSNVTTGNANANYNWNRAPGFGFYPSLSYGYGYSPFFPSPYYGGSGFRLSVSYGFGSPYSSFYNPYSSFYNPYGFNSFYGYNGFYDPYDPFYWDRWRYGSAYSSGYAQGYYTGSSLNSGSYGSNDYNTGVVSVRKVTRAPRTTRGTSNYSRNYNDNRSGNDDNRVYIDRGSVAVKSGRTSTGARNNYYKRTRTRSTDDASTRTSQQRTRSYNDSGNYTQTSRSGSSTSRYSRTSTSTSRNYSGSTGRSSRNFRFGSNTNRSSGTYRGSNVRSSSSYRSGSSPSRTRSYSSGSSGSSRSFSSGTRSSGTRSSGSAGRRKQ